MSLELIVDGRKALPVRALPFVSGWMLSPDVVAMTFANTDHWNTRLEGVSAYHLMSGGQYAPMLPKEWDGIEAGLQILSERLKKSESFEQENYSEWRRQSIPLLPAACFVWKDEFEQAFKRSYSRYKYILVNERPGDRELNLTPFVPQQMGKIIMEGFLHLPDAAIAAENMEKNEPGRRQQQLDAIVEVIEKLGYEPMAVPDSGKAKIKSIVLSQPKLFTDRGFEHAWRSGVTSQLFRLQNSEKFSKKSP